MASSRPQNDQDPLDPSDPEIGEDLRQLSGEPAGGRPRIAFTPDEIAETDEGLTGTEIERGYLEAGIDPTGSVPAEFEGVEALVERELRNEETFDPDIASEEGVPWVPPVDPVVVPDKRDPEGLRVAAGIATSALDEPYDVDHHGEPLPAEDEMTDRVREALRDDAQTTAYADDLEIDTESGVVTLRGTVADMDDLEAVLAVAAVVEGVTEVRDELEVAAV
jgi:BON domain-containing protein